MLSLSYARKAAKALSWLMRRSNGIGVAAWPVLDAGTEAGVAFAGAETAVFRTGC